MYKNHQRIMLMTEGAIGKKILVFAFPVFLANLFQQLYNVVDALIVGNLIGDDALAAVTSSGHLISFLTAFSMGIFAGAGVVVSKYYGARKKEELGKCIHTTMGLALLFGIICAFIGVFLSPVLLRLMNTPETVLPNSIIYFRIYFCGGIPLVIYSAGAGILQGVGDSRHPLYYIVIASFTNVCLDLLFVGWFQMRIAGVALATVLSQLLSAVLVIQKLRISEDEIRLQLRKIEIHKDYAGEILKMGIPSGIQNSVVTFSNTIIQSGINGFGENAVAGCGAYSKLDGFTSLPITSFSMALTAFVGQNVGARNTKRVKQGARFGIVVTTVLSLAIGMIVYVFIPDIMKIFTRNSEVIAYGVKQAHITSLFLWEAAICHSIAAVLRGAGKALVPMLIMIVFWCGLRMIYVPLVLTLTNSLSVVLWVYPITWGISAIIYSGYYLSGRWLPK